MQADLHKVIFLNQGRIPKYKINLDFFCCEKISKLSPL